MMEILDLEHQRTIIREKMTYYENELARQDTSIIYQAYCQSRINYLLGMDSALAFILAAVPVEGE